MPQKKKRKKKLFNPGTGNKKCLINVIDLANGLSTDIGALLSLHDFTIRDSTNSFKGLGKITPLAIVQKSAKFQSLFA